MLSNTRGIVLKHHKYSESSIIVRIFTEEFGLQSYMVKGIRSKKSKLSMALFQPLTLLDIVTYHKENRSLQHLTEVTVSYAYQQIPGDAERRSILIFLNEILIKAIREESPDKALFGWLYQMLTWLDLTGKQVNNFHLLWMIQLSRFLGFFPKRTPGEQSQIFDLREGLFTFTVPEHAEYLSGSVVKIVENLVNCPVEDIASLRISNDERRKILDILITYYRLHLPGFGEVKSAEILKTILA